MVEIIFSNSGRVFTAETFSEKRHVRGRRSQGIGRLFQQPQYRTSLPRAPIDLQWVHDELRRTGVTLQLLWTEYVEAAQARDGEPPYQYTQFCELYHRWRGRLDLVMRQTHRAGEKAFIDYSGKRPSIVDASTGEVIDVERRLRAASSPL